MKIIPHFRLFYNDDLPELELMIFALYQETPPRRGNVSPKNSAHLANWYLFRKLQELQGQILTQERPGMIDRIWLS